MIGVLCAGPLVRAGLQLGTTFSDNMVLQRNQPVTVWGQADPHASVQVQLGDQTSSATADALGHWSVSLKPLPVGGPYRGSITSGSDSIELKNILSGDVWLCSGQSNMQLGTGEDAQSEQMIAQCRALPNLRLLSIPKFGAEKPVYLVKAHWETTDSPVLVHFSAVAIHLGLNLAADPKLAGVPIGLIDSSFGGTSAEGWVPISALGDFSKQDFSVSMFNLGPGMLYNNMIAPLGPLSLTGVVWYQGENNSGKAKLYPRFMRSLISQWRKQFHQDDLPFVIVQLPPFVDLYAGYPFTWLREAQSLVARDNPNTGLVVSIDTTNGFNLHPREKGEIGRRAALQARRLAYHEQIVADGPMLKSARSDGASMVLTFDTHDGPLVTHGDAGKVPGFALAGDDGVFHFADAKIQGDDMVVVRCTDVPAPKFARYAWGAVPEYGLYNKAGLPAGPFRTDDFPIEVPIEIKPVPTSRHVATGLYDVVISGNGDLLSLGSAKQQFVSNNLDGFGTANFPGFFGPRQLQAVVPLTPSSIRFGDAGATVTYHFFSDSMSEDIQNLSTKSSDKLNYHLRLSDGVHAEPAGDGFQLSRGNIHVHLTGADHVQGDPNGGANVDLSVDGNSTRTLTFSFSKP